ncbi:MAG: MFS transporter [Burkholderiales bacterium]|nr:MFS transporter [Burkholderiales bacterium]
MLVQVGLHGCLLVCIYHRTMDARWMVLVSVMVGTMASIMSATVVNVAIPEMSHYFVLGQDRAHWVSSGFMLATTLGMLTTPWVLARYGYRMTYVGTMLLLMAGGVAGGLADSFALVLAARVAEGLAAGVVQPIPAVIIMRAFEPSEQGKATSLFGMGVVLAPALGPSIGGVLVDLFGWRSIFFMVVPFCLGSIWMAYRYVPNVAPGGTPMQKDMALDWVGLVLATVATTCLLNGLVELQGTSRPLGIALLAGALIATGAFIAWQRGAPAAGREPLMDLRVFAHPTFTMGVVVSLIYGIALFGSTYLLPVYMQLALRLPAAHVGTILLPAGLALALTIGGVGRLTHRVPTYVLVTTGLLLLAASFALMPTVGLASPLGLLMAWAILGRVGLGFILTSLNIGSMRALDKGLLPHGSSTINFVRTLGGAAGISLCALVLEWRLAVHGDSLANPQTGAARLAAFNESFLMLAATCALAMLAAWRLREPAQKAPAGE